MMTYIFILYCVSCEQSHPNHRIINAYKTLEGCYHAKESVKATVGSVLSCEKVAFYQF
jgi:hypothetical protein